MNNSVLVHRHTFIFADSALFAVYGRGLINEVKTPVQELEGQRGEGAYFRENTVFIRNQFSSGALAF